MNMKPSPLRNLDLSDSEVVADITAEKARELVNAYERINDLEDAVRGLIGLTQLIANRPDITPDMREALTMSHRILDAIEVLK